jgi:hypothetical protein
MLEPIPNTGMLCSGAFPSMTMPASGQLAGQQQYASGMFADACDRLHADVVANGGKMNVIEHQVCLCSGAISSGYLGESRLPDFCGTVPIQTETTCIPRGDCSPIADGCEQCLKKDARIAELEALLLEYQRDAGEIDSRGDR